MKFKKTCLLTALLTAFLILFTSCFLQDEPQVEAPPVDTDSEIAYIDHNGGVPQFDIPSSIIAYEKYSDLDALGRCGVAEACIGTELMPTDDRGSIGNVEPSGWVQAEYPGVVNGTYLYNRCHLIGFQLTGENDNEKNLITGTRFLNIEGMLPFENMVADYIKETGNHVMYRVTPVYQDSYDLLPYGVIMEALSLEDNGEGISFAIFAYNRQPGVVINYSDGTSYLSGSTPPATQEPDETPSYYVININSKRFHLPDRACADSIGEANREERECDRQSLIDEGFTPCGTCKP